MKKAIPVVCWCGNQDLAAFSTEYGRCPRCETLVSTMPDPRIGKVVDDEKDFYGKDYWFSHQLSDLGQADIETRAVTDLPERCLHWLRALLRYKTPPGRILELGSAHGGFVALLRWAGFDAAGLEMSPWVADFARRTFEVPTLQGPVEEQAVEEGSLDAIALMDVLEHLPQPAKTMAHCLRLLKPDGVLFLQTPHYVEGSRHAEMVERQDRFLEQLKADEHLFLFSESSIGEFFRRLGVRHVAFEPALFAHYDMCVVASRAPLTGRTESEVHESLLRVPGARLIQALLTVDSDLRAAQAARAEVAAHLASSEADRAARLELLEKQARDFERAIATLEADRAARGAVIEQQARDFEQAVATLEADRAARGALIEQQARDFEQAIATLEADRAARGAVIEQQARDFERALSTLEADRVARGAVIEQQARDFAQAIATIEADRAARGALIEQQARDFAQALATVQADSAVRLEVIERQGRLLAQLGAVLQRLQKNRLYQVLRLVGAWRWMDAMLAPPAPENAKAEDAKEETGMEATPNDFDVSFAKVREPKKRGGVGYAEGAEQRLADGLRAQGIEVTDFAIDVADYRRYLASARYLEDFPAYYASNVPEKSLEHYLAAKLLALGPEDVYIDVASEHSPVPEIYGRLFGPRTYRQDLAYPPGLHGDRIGGSAAEMPIPDGMASRMALHCSFEHFEGNADTAFVKEASRVLRPGGRLFIGPLYLHEEYAIQTDPEVAVREAVPFEEDAVVYAAPGWGNRHGRFYDPSHFARRIHQNRGDLQARVYRIINASEVDPGCYIRFAALFTKPDGAHPPVDVR